MEPILGFAHGWEIEDGPGADSITAVWLSPWRRPCLPLKASCEYFCAGCVLSLAAMACSFATCNGLLICYLQGSFYIVACHDLLLTTCLVSYLEFFPPYWWLQPLWAVFCFLDTLGSLSSFVRAFSPSRSFWTPPPLSSRQPPYSSSLSANSSSITLSVMLSNTQELVSPCSHQALTGMWYCNCLFARKALHWTQLLEVEILFCFAYFHICITNIILLA